LARADQRDSFTVLRLGRLRQTRAHVAAVVGRDALQAADRDGLLLHPATSARGLARAIANTAEDRRENVRLAIQQIGVVEAAESDQPDVLGHVGMRGAGPLAIDDTVEKFACGIRRIHR